MEENTVAGVASDTQRFSASMLASRPELFRDKFNQRYFRIRAADSSRERRSANSLIDRMYATRGYQSTPLSDEECPNRRTFLASDHDVALGTLTIGFDSPERLLADSLFPSEVEFFRAQGRGVCEFTKLAMDRRASSRLLLAALFHVAYIYAHRVKGLHNLLIEVNPRHVRYYEAMLGFTVIGVERHNERVNAPAVLLSLDLCYAQEQIRLFGGRPDMAASERSAYPHFFSAEDEAGIVGRLEGSDDEDIARVLESDYSRNVPPRVDPPLH